MATCRPITTEVPTTASSITVSFSGSYFGTDSKADGKISNREKTVPLYRETSWRYTDK